VETSPAEIKNCKIFFNCGDKGSAIWSTDSDLQVMNSLIYKNHMTDSSVVWGSLVFGGGTPVITNSTIVEEVSGYGLVATNESFPVVSNSIIWYNAAGGFAVAPNDSEITFAYSDVQDGVQPGEGNISALPRFVAPNTTLPLSPPCPLTSSVTDSPDGHLR